MMMDWFRGGKTIVEAEDNATKRIPDPNMLEELRRRNEISKASVKRREPNWFLLSPLLFAPLLPLIRITLRKQPKIRDVLFKGTLAAAFLHSATIACGFYNTDNFASEDEKK